MFEWEAINLLVWHLVMDKFTISLPLTHTHTLALSLALLKVYLL